MRDDVALEFTSLSHTVMEQLAKAFAVKAGYDPETVNDLHHDHLTDHLKELSPGVVNTLFEDPPDEFAEFTSHDPVTGVPANE